MMGLANLLPYLALAGLALEATPVSAKSHGVARHPRSHAPRTHNLPVARGAQPRSKSNVQILRREDGSRCRVRPAAAAARPAPAAANNEWQPAAENNQWQEPAPQNDQWQEPAPQNDQWQEPAPQNDQSGEWQEPAPQNDWQEPSQDSNQSNDAEWNNLYSDHAAPPPEPQQSTGVALGGGRKVGLAWPDPGINIQPFLGSRVGWYYTWRCTPVDSASSLDFAPMLWGPNHNPFRWANDNPWLPGEFQDKMDNVWGNSASVQNVLFFNEPEIGSQANIAAEDGWGGSIWMQYFLPARTKYGKRLGSASCTSGQANADWVNTFKQTCKNAGGSDYDCTPDFYPLHYYDVLLDSGEYEGYHLTGFKDYIAHYHQMADPSKPIWVTEYGCHSFNGYSTCDWNRAKAFQEGAAAWMDAQDYIERYSSFGTVTDMQGVAEGNRLMDAGGGITELGKYILGAY